MIYLGYTAYEVDMLYYLLNNTGDHTLCAVHPPSRDTNRSLVVSSATTLSYDSNHS
jgi:hypothetical protein